MEAGHAGRLANLVRKDTESDMRSSNASVNVKTLVCKGAMAAGKATDRLAQKCLIPIIKCTCVLPDEAADLSEHGRSRAAVEAASQRIPERNQSTQERNHSYTKSSLSLRQSAQHTLPCQAPAQDKDRLRTCQYIGPASIEDVCQCAAGGLCFCRHNLDRFRHEMCDTLQVRFFSFLAFAHILSLDATGLYPMTYCCHTLACLACSAFSPMCC
jgi:hypothetical protein